MESPISNLHSFQSTPSAWRETTQLQFEDYDIDISIHSLRMEGDVIGISTPIFPFLYFNPLPPHGGRHNGGERLSSLFTFQSTPSAWRETGICRNTDSRICYFNPLPPHGGRHYNWQLYSNCVCISIHSLRMEGDSKTAQESVFHFAYPCTILQKRMQKTTFCTRKNGFFRKKGEKFGAKPSASFCAPMIRTDTFPLNFSHRISGSSMSMVSFAPICSTFD